MLSNGAADATMRAVAALTGPWTAPRPIYRPPEHNRPNVMIFVGKAHPHLTGADLVLTSATNTLAGAEVLRDTAVDYPRFVRLTKCR